VRSQSDNQIMLNVREGDLDKLSILFERYHKTLFNFFFRLTNNRMISEDLVQEVFLRMLNYRHTYRGDGKFSNWMFHISRNVHVDYFKKHSREQQLTNDEQDVVSRDSNCDNTLVQAQEVELLRTALARLPIEKREALVLSRFQNMKYEDIAALQCCQVGTIKARIHRAIKELRNIYSKLSGENLS